MVQIVRMRKLDASHGGWQLRRWALAGSGGRLVKSVASRTGGRSASGSALSSKSARSSTSRTGPRLKGSVQGSAQHPALRGVPLRRHAVDEPGFFGRSAYYSDDAGKYYADAQAKKQIYKSAGGRFHSAAGDARKYKKAGSGVVRSAGGHHYAAPRSAGGTHRYDASPLRNHQLHSKDGKFYFDKEHRHVYSASKWGRHAAKYDFKSAGGRSYQGVGWWSRDGPGHSPRHTTNPVGGVKLAYNRGKKAYVPVQSSRRALVPSQAFSSTTSLLRAMDSARKHAAEAAAKRNAEAKAKRNAEAEARRKSAERRAEVDRKNRLARQHAAEAAARRASGSRRNKATRSTGSSRASVRGPPPPSAPSRTQ